MSIADLVPLVPSICTNDTETPIHCPYAAAFSHGRMDKYYVVQVARVQYFTASFRDLVTGLTGEVCQYWFEFTFGNDTMNCLTCIDQILYKAPWRVIRRSGRVTTLFCAGYSRFCLRSGDCLGELEFMKSLSFLPIKPALRFSPVVFVLVSQTVSELVQLVARCTTRYSGAITFSNERRNSMP